MAYTLLFTSLLLAGPLWFWAAAAVDTRNARLALAAAVALPLTGVVAAGVLGGVFG